MDLNVSFQEIDKTIATSFRKEQAETDVGFAANSNELSIQFDGNETVSDTIEFGSSERNMEVEFGEVQTASTPVPGKDGLSAYEIAVKNGFRGSEKEWLASLKGDPAKDGQDGTPGRDGSDGITPHIGENGNWYIGEIDTGIPATGPAGGQGLPGAPGKDGYTPVKGVDYFDGTPGKDGVDGKDGYTPVKGVDYFDGLPGKDGVDGEPGKDGVDGLPGKDGYTPVKGIDYFDGLPGADGKPGDPGKDGIDGYTPIKGIDYFDGEKGDPGKDGYTPVKGVDYFDGAPGADGQPGKDGYSPVRGKDYWTDADKQKIIDDVLEESKPSIVSFDGTINTGVSSDSAQGTKTEKVVEVTLVLTTAPSGSTLEAVEMPYKPVHQTRNFLANKHGQLCRIILRPTGMLDIYPVTDGKQIYYGQIVYITND